MSNSDWQETYLGKVPTDWRYCSIGDLIRDEIIERPIDGNHGETHPKESDYVSDGIPFVMASDMENGTINLSACKFITEEQASRLRKGFSLPGDVLLSHKATLGRTAIVPELDTPYVMLTPQVTYYRVKSEEQLSSCYLHWFFRSYKFQRALEAYGGAGSTRAYIGITEQKDLPVILASHNEQVLIAEILSSLDEKIELNRKQNRTLEAIAQALFKRWFVEFEFPDKNGQPYKSSGGAMQPSELGEIPVGWRVGKLEEIISELETGSRPKGGVSRFTDGVPSIGAESITRIGEFDYLKTKYVPEEYFARMRRGIIKERDVLIYKDGGTPGRFDIRISMFGGGFPYETACINEHVFRLQAKNPVYQNYLYLWFSSYLILEELRFRGAKAAIPGINTTDVKELDFLFMDERVLEKFDEVIEPLFLKLLHNSREMAVLSKLLDILLPKLMSGELRVA